MISKKRIRKLVVAGLVVDGEQILITQRTSEQAMPLKWEFPGGKIEPGEAPEEALARELKEEIGVEVVVHRVWDVLSYPYPDFDLLMLIYPCQILGAQPARCCEVADLAWVRCEELPSYDVLVADKPVVERLMAEGLAGLGT